MAAGTVTSGAERGSVAAGISQAVSQPDTIGQMDCASHDSILAAAHPIVQVPPFYSSFVFTCHCFVETCLLKLLSIRHSFTQ